MQEKKQFLLMQLQEGVLDELVRDQGHKTLEKWPNYKDPSCKLSGFSEVFPRTSTPRGVELTFGDFQKSTKKVFSESFPKLYDST